MRYLCLLLVATAGTLFAQTPVQVPALDKVTALTPPYLDLNPGPHYWPRVRIWQGIPGITRAPGGRLWATWYTGLLGEGKGQNYDVLVTSDDDGKTWSRPVAVYDPSRNFLNADTGDPMLWVDPKGRMWWFVNRAMKVKEGAGKTCWAFYTENPDAPRPEWKGPIFAGYGNTLNKPLVLPDGSWLHMVDWHYDKTKMEGDEFKKGAHLYKFVDYDKPFVHYSYATVPDSIFAEHMVVPRNDGSLWMLARTKYGIAQTESKDGGKTWSEATPLTKDFNINTRFYLTRLKSGNFLLVVNDHPKARANMTAMLSKDEGKTWPYKLVLDEREPVSYPDGLQADNGFIYAIYDRGRYRKDMQEILLAKFTEEDIEAGKLVNPESRLKQTVSHLATEGGGVHYDGETNEMRAEWGRLFPDSAEGKRMQLEEGEKAELKVAPSPTPKP